MAKEGMRNHNSEQREFLDPLLMPVTSILGTSGGKDGHPAREWIDRTFPRIPSVKIYGAGFLKGPSSSGVAASIGRAVDYLVRAKLDPDGFTYADTIACRRETDAAKSLAELPANAETAAVAGLLEGVARAGLRSLPSIMNGVLPSSYERILEGIKGDPLAKDVIPGVEALMEFIDRSRMFAGRTMEVGNPVVGIPQIGVQGDGDAILNGGEWVDFKAVNSPSLGRKQLLQVAMYVLLNEVRQQAGLEHYHVARCGFAMLRHGMGRTWPVEEYLAEVCGAGRGMSELAAEFLEWQGSLHFSEVYGEERMLEPGETWTGLLRDVWTD